MTVKGKKVNAIFMQSGAKNVALFKHTKSLI